MMARKAANEKQKMIIVCKAYTWMYTSAMWQPRVMINMMMTHKEDDN